MPDAVTPDDAAALLAAAGFGNDLVDTKIAAQAEDTAIGVGSEPQEAAPHGGDEPGVPTRKYRYLVPLAEAANDFAEQARTLTEGKRIYTGIDVFDKAMRGLAPKQLMIVQGYAHQGKTVFVTEMMRHNHDARMALFTVDEDRVLVLAKLASLVHGISAEELEARIARGDDEAERLVRATAEEHFPNLVVFDDVSTLPRMTDALNECRDHWGAREQFAAFDYANLLAYDGDVIAKIDALKSWGKDNDVPFVLMHQASRTNGAKGAAMTIDSGSHGGEQQATFMIGVRRMRSYWDDVLRDLNERKRSAMKDNPLLDDKIAEAEFELQRHQNTITLNLVKNKRPPGHLVGDTDFTLDKNTGRIYPVDMAFSQSSAVGRAVQPPERVYGAHVPMFDDHPEDF